MKDHVLNRFVFIAVFTLIVLTSRHASAQVGAGDQAPPISVDHLRNAPEGLSLSWEDYKDKTVVIEFWGTWCGPCVAAIPHLNELYDELHPQGIEFLSVTFEEPAIVERFVERMPMKSWIGCDTDRSMVEAYGISGWPTTFVVRNGVIVERTHPSQLTAERILALASGEVKPKADRPAESGSEVGEDGRPPAGAFMPGNDPYSKLGDPPIFQIIVREAGSSQMSGSSGSGATMLGTMTDSIINSLWDLPNYAIRGEPELLEKRYDVIYRLPSDMREDYLPHLRDVVARSMGLRVELGTETIQGFALRPGDAGVKLPEGVFNHVVGYSMNGDENGRLTISGASMGIGLLTSWLSSVCQAPVLDETGLEGRYFFVQLEFTSNDANTIRDEFEKATGLVFVPIETEVEIARISPLGD